MTEAEKKITTYSQPLCAVLFVLGVLFFTGADQLMKYLASVYLKDGGGIPLIPGVLELKYLENKGMAFGMLQGKQVFLIGICLVFLAVVFYGFVRVPKNRYYLPLIVAGAVLAGGAAGNGIDRLLRGYVVDYIYFSLIDFPVFNLADIYMVCGGIFLVLIIIFRYQDGDFDFCR